MAHNVPKSRDIQAKIPLPKAIFVGFLLVTVNVLNSYGGLRITTSAEELKPMKTYKDRMFRMIFSEKEKLLELYNAVSGKHYKDPELLTINTLENAIYMPLRLLHYILDLYESMVNPIKLYGSSPVQIPPPRFIVFCNGIKEKPEREELCLSRLYRNEMSIEEAVERAITECIAEWILEFILPELNLSHGSGGCVGY